MLQICTTDKGRKKHITDVLKSPNQLPVRTRIDRKLDMLKSSEPLRPLRSSDSCVVAVLRFNSKFSEAAFSVYWNKLPDDLCSDSHYL